jgi:hypothetical protein
MESDIGHLESLLNALNEFVKTDSDIEKIVNGQVTNNNLGSSSEPTKPKAFILGTNIKKKAEMDRMSN